MELWYIWRFDMGKNIGQLWQFLRRSHDYQKNRGMSKLTDIRDWLGGWPMEFVRDEDAVTFVETLGFKLEKIAAGKRTPSSFSVIAGS